MLNQRLRIGIQVGLVTTAATSGALIGFGLRHHAALQPFEITGASLLAARLGVLAVPTVSAATGAVVHAAWMIVWGVVFVTVVQGGGRSRVLSACVVAGGVGALAYFLFAPAMGAAASANLSLGQGLVLLAIFAASLAAGLRLVEPRAGASEAMRY